MVVALGPGKFYGSSLPRPRIYTDVKFNDDRVDPPVPVLEPLMSWAHEAHWSMGGLNVKRHRLQGRIEGNIKKLRAQREKFLKKRKQTGTAQIGKISDKDSGSERSVSPSPPPAPIAVKRRRFLGLVDEEEEEREVEGGGGVRRRPARKLWDDFNRVATERSPVKRSSGGSEGVGLRTRSRRVEKEDGGGGDGAEKVEVVEEVSKSIFKDKKLKGNNGKGKRSGENGASGTRTSPRLVKRGSS